MRDHYNYRGPDGFHIRVYESDDRFWIGSIVGAVAVTLIAAMLYGHLVPRVAGRRPQVETVDSQMMILHEDSGPPYEWRTCDEVEDGEICLDGSTGLPGVVGYTLTLSTGGMADVIVIE